MPKINSSRDFLDSMSMIDALNDHDHEACGQCMSMFIMAEVAREMLQGVLTKESIHLWNDESRRRWHATKFFKLWLAEVSEGRDPHQAFADRGWEP